MDSLKIETLSESNGIRNLWHAYDILYDVQKGCTGIEAEIYGGPDSFRKKIRTSEIVVLTASTKTNEILGGLSYRLSGDRRISLDYLGVKEGFRGKGFGGALIDNIITLAREDSDFIIRLLCKIDSDAFSLYQKKGFLPIWGKETKTFVKMEFNSSPDSSSTKTL